MSVPPHSGCLSSSHRPCSDPWSKSDRPLLPLTGTVQPLSSQSLRATSSTGTDPHHLLYWVVQGPQLGRLFHTQQGSTGEALVNFTQAEVGAQLSVATVQVAHSAMDTCGHGYQVQHSWQYTSWASYGPHHACLALQEPLAHRTNRA